MNKTLQIINRMHKEGLFKKYAIGGGIASLFYIEPIATFDLDIFVILPESEEVLLSLSPLYDWLSEKKYKLVKEHIIIEGIPVQFIPVYNELVIEAVLKAVRKKYEGISTFVLKPEYLMAIMLDTNRSKDRERIIKMLDEAEISADLLKTILNAHGLIKAYNNFINKFHEK